MGYLSQVGIALTNSAAKKLAEAIDKADEETAHDVNSLLAANDNNAKEASGAVAYIWDNVKWYDDYPAMKFFDALFSNLDCSEYLFVRVGESEDDAETQGCFFANPFDLRLVRCVEMLK